MGAVGKLANGRGSYGYLPGFRWTFDENIDHAEGNCNCDRAVWDLDASGGRLVVWPLTETIFAGCSNICILFTNSRGFVRGSLDNGFRGQGLL